MGDDEMKALLNTTVGDLRVADLSEIMTLICKTLPSGFDPDTARGKRYGARTLRSLHEKRTKKAQSI